MERIDLKKTAERALKQLSAAGMSAKALHGYTHTGFGCAIRHFRRKGESSATSEMLDVFVIEQRELFEQSGLRACDVVRLKLGSIDWRLREIRLVQHKTGQPLSLPLEAESGNAIADYILHGRPNLALSNLFLCHSGTDRPLDARTASGIVSKYMLRAGIPSRRRAFHALRRTFGTGLLQNNVSFELIQQLLGHTDMNSLKPYLTIDEQGLKQCALPLLSYGKDGGGK